VVVEHSCGVLDLIESVLLERLCIGEEPVGVARILQRRCRLAPNVLAHLGVLQAHLNQVLETNDTLSVHTAFSFLELAQKCFLDAFDTGRLELVVFVGHHLKNLGSVLLLARLVVALGDHLGDAKDPLHSLLFETVIDLKETSDLLQSLVERLDACLVYILQVRFGHFLADLGIVFCHVEQDVGEIALIGPFAGLDHLLQDVFVRDDL